VNTSEPKVTDLVDIFNQLFATSENTILETGAKEPFYQAAGAEQTAIIFSRDDFFSSALHEIAHWTIAGNERRKLDDFGYWYEAEGRSEEQQQEFELVEIKPQAIEWVLSLACNHRFHFSADNIAKGLEASETFKDCVRLQALDYLKSSLPKRAQLLYQELIKHFRRGEAVRSAEVTRKSDLVRKYEVLRVPKIENKIDV